jgi:hypothetical protein
MIRFADAYNPTPHFRSKWCESYASSVRSLWERCVQAYKAGHAAPGSPEELLMCFAYDVVLGPNLGVPEPHKLAFLRWLLDSLRQAFRCSTA